MMIKVTAFNDSIFYINAELIELVEQTPDTIITLTTEKKILVKENVEEIISRVIDYKRRINNSKVSGMNLQECTN